MSQMHFQSPDVAGVSVSSAAVLCSRCGGGPMACVVLQGEDPHYRQSFCKTRCWPALLRAVDRNEELDP